MSKDDSTTLRSLSDLKVKYNTVEQDILDGVLLEVYDLPEVILAAQITALKEEQATAKREEAAKRKFAESESKLSAEMAGLDETGSIIQQTMKAMKMQVKTFVLNDPDITSLRAELGDKFVETIEKKVEGAIGKSTLYQSKQAEFAELKKKAIKLQKRMDKEAKDKTTALKRAATLKGKATRLGKQIASLQSKLAQI